MDAAGIDMHVLTVNNDFYRYELDPALTQEIARACNEEIGQMMTDHPDRFTGLPRCRCRTSNGDRRDGVRDVEPRVPRHHHQ